MNKENLKSAKDWERWQAQKFKNLTWMPAQDREPKSYPCCVVWKIHYMPTTGGTALEHIFIYPDDYK
jgi:hypothetical protein